MSAYIHTYMYTYIYACMHHISCMLYAYRHIYRYRHLCMCAYIHTYRYTCVNTCSYTYMHTCIQAHVCLHTYMPTYNSHVCLQTYTFPDLWDCLCGISTRQFEILVWRARPHNQICMEDCTIFLVQFHSVNLLKNKVLATYVNCPATRWHITGNPTTSNLVKSFGQTLRRGCWAIGSCSPGQHLQLSSAITIQTIGKLFA